MQTPTLFAFQRLTGDEVTHIDHVTQLAYFLVCLDAFEEVFCLFIEQVQSLPSPTQTQIRTDDSDISGHDLSYFFDILCDKHAFFIGQGAFIVPCRNFLVEIVVFYHTETMFGSCIGINNRFDKRVRRQTVTAVQTRT